MTRTLSLSAVCGDSQVFRQDGAKLRDAIENAWSQVELVDVDFEGKRIASTSFLDEGLALLFTTHPVEEVRRRLTLSNMTERDRQLLNVVIRQRLQQPDLGDAFPRPELSA